MLRGLPSWSSARLQSSRASPPPARSISVATPSRRSRDVPEHRGSASPGVLTPRTPLQRVPLSAARSLPVTGGGRELPHPVGAVLRVPAPLDGSGRLAVCSRSLGPVARRGPLCFAAFSHAARVPGLSLQSFPFPGSRARSHGPLLPCGFASGHRQRRVRESFTIAFPDARQLFAGGPPGGGPDA